MHPAKLEPGVEYLVLSDMDEADLAAFILRLKKAREILATAQYAGCEDPVQQNAREPDMVPGFKVDFKSGGDFNVFDMIDIHYSHTTIVARPHERIVNLLIAEKPQRTRGLNIREPLRIDGSNVSSRKEVTAETVIAQIDRWLDLASRPVWRADTAWSDFTSDLWQTFGALLDADGSDEIYQRLAMKLVFLLGGPYAPLRLVPNVRSNNFDVLTASGAAAWANMLPKLVELKEERGERTSTYSFAAVQVEERPGSNRRQPGNILEVMRLLQAFGDVDGPILTPNVGITV